MTERKPPGMKSEDWVEAQIRQAQARGEFDDLPGAGKPIPKLAEPPDPDWWVKDFIRREKIETDALLPPSVQLRKEKEQLAGKLAKMRTEREVREYLQDLNQRILVQIRDATGVVVPVGTVDKEYHVEQWLRDRPAPSRTGPPRNPPKSPSAASGAACSPPDHTDTRRDISQLSPAVSPGGAHACVRTALGYALDNSVCRTVSC